MLAKDWFVLNLARLMILIVYAVSLGAYAARRLTAGIKYPSSGAGHPRNRIIGDEYIGDEYIG